MGTAVVPVKDGQPLRDEDVQQLPEEEREEIDRKRRELDGEIRNPQKEYRRLDREARETVNELDRGVVRNRIDGPFDDLRGDVVEAIETGMFNVWAVSSVAEGIERLTGATAGEPDSETGAFPEGTIFGAVRARLAEFSETLRRRGNNDRGAENARPSERE